MPSVSDQSSRGRSRRREAARGAAPPLRHATLTGWWAGTPADKARTALFVALVALVALGGGSSWPDAWKLLFLRPLAILLVTVAPAIPGARPRPALRAPGRLLAVLALVIAVQLVPLPPAWWTALPGHALYREAAAAAGRAQPWRPITVSMDLTLNSLVSLTIPGAALLGAAVLRPDQRVASAGLMIAVATVSALMGLLQVTVSPGLYLYPLSMTGRPAGLFVNINHQAAFLAAMIPVVAAWAVAPRRPAPIRGMVAASVGVLLLALVLTSGSRSGLLLAAVALVSVPLIIGDRLRLSGRARWLAIGGALATPIALVAAVWLAGQLSGLERLLGGGADDRVAFLPVTLGLARAYLPFGSGFGTFDAVFRQAEPDAILQLTYFNHAHNDALELAITGGLAAVALALAYLVWLARRGAAAWGAERREAHAPLARAGLLAVLILLLASLTDYPLRTPLASALLAMASLWAAERGPCHAG